MRIIDFIKRRKNYIDIRLLNYLAKNGITIY